MNNPAIEAYKNTSFEAAPPLKIVRMLYAGAARYLEQAQELDPVADTQVFNERLGKVDAIVSELICALEPEHSPELAEQLEKLYLFVQARISTARLDQSVEPIEEARQVLETLRVAWDELELGGEKREVA